MIDSALDRLRELAAGPEPIETDETVAQVLPYITVAGVTQQQLSFAVQAAWLLSVDSGKLETPETVWAEYSNSFTQVGLSEIMLDGLYRDKEFHRAIYLRGIRHENNGLDARMVLGLQVLTDFTSKKSPLAKLKLVGIKPYEYTAWLNYKPFAEKLAKMSTKALGGSVSNAKITLANRAVDGDLNAIKFLFEVTGEHDPATKAQFDGMRLVRGMAELMMEYIKDPETMREIAGKVQLLVASSGLEQ